MKFIFIILTLFIYHTDFAQTPTSQARIALMDSAMDYRNLSNKYYLEKNYNLAMICATESIKIFRFNGSYKWRGQIKMTLGDYNGALNDFDKEIFYTTDTIGKKVLHFDYMSFYERGRCKYYLKRYKEAIFDFNIMLNEFNDHSPSLFYRGLSKIKLGNKIGGCQDLSKAGEEGYSDAYEEIKKQCNN
jgi:tetratricopeptide (TPR) repeat protein